MKYSLLSYLILFSAFAMGQNQSAETPKIAIKVPLGETVTVKGVSVKFLEVLEDSRCPEGANCIWEGRAIVKVRVSANGNSGEKILLFGALMPGEEKNTNIYSTDAFAINGLTLQPYPKADSGKEKNYELLICEEKNR